MKRISTFLVLGFLLAPNLTLAVTEVCSKDGYTVLTMNGVFTDERGAQINKEKLERLLGTSYGGEKLKTDYLLNDTHLAGLGDILKAIGQKIFDNETVDDYDLVEMLKDASEKVTTRKLLLVAHSQGNFYANSFYDKVVGKDGGVPTESIGVYSVATPSGRVAGGGKYLTSGTDKVISGVVGSVPFRRILSPNTYIELKDGDDPLGHNFAGVYLKYKGAEIVQDIEESLGKLQTPPPPNPSSTEEGRPCIDPPTLSLAHKIEGVVFAVADPVANVSLATAMTTLGGVNTMGQFVTVQGVNAIAGLGGLTTKTAEMFAVGVSGLGSLVTYTSAKVATVMVDAGKVVSKTVADVFQGSTGQTASVATALPTGGSEIAVGETKTKGVEDTPPRLADSPSAQGFGGTPSAPLLTQGGEENPPPLGLPLESVEVRPPSTVKEETTQAPTPTLTIPPLSTPQLQATTTEILGGEEKKADTASSTTPQNTLPVQTSAPTTSDINTTYIRRTTTARGDTTAPDVPIVTSPTAHATFTTTNVTFVGTAEADSIISSDFSTSTVVATGGAWSLTFTLSQGTTTILFSATDSAGNRSVATSLVVFVDSVLPDVSLTSSTCTGTLSSSACLVATTTLAFSWSSIASDTSYFNLDKNGTFSTTTATSTSLTASDESTYTFKVASVDIHGNVSATSTQAVEVFTVPVVINEIAWAGTAASSFDEWIELYNRTGRALSLSSMTLYASDLSPYISLSGTIGAGGYFLIERTDDTTVNNISADLIAPFSGSGGGSGLSNNGENLLLVLVSAGATTTLDTVASCSGGGTTWCGGSDSSFTTLERYDASVSGSLSTNWFSHMGEFIRNGTDANNGNLSGTPRAKNSVSYLIASGGTLGVNKTLTSANSPYLVNRSGLVVSSGVTLTINPGVVIKIVSNNEPWIRVAGTINANGTSASPVVFTSFLDDDYGGDMNADGSATTPSAGNWRRLFVDTTSVGSTFTNTLVRYAGNNNITDSVAYKGAIGVDSATVTFDGLVVERSNFYGLSLSNSNSTITNSRFSTSTNSSVSATGVYISGGSPSISSSIFSGNYRGVTIVSATPTLTGNTFASSTVEAIVNTGVVGSFSGNGGSGNGTNAILIGQGGTITTAGATTTLLANNLPYLVKGTATVASGSTLSFATGVVVKGWDSSGSNHGLISVPSGAVLHSSGTTASDLVFTSKRDSSVGGTVSSGMSAVAPGDWMGIEVSAGGRVSLSGFTLKYAGASATLGTSASSIYKGAIKITGNSATSSGSISNALFSNNYQSGLNLDSVSSLTLSNVTFQNHTEENAGTATAIYALNSTSTLSNITFTSNQRDGTGLGINALTCTSCGSPNTTPANLFGP